MRWLFILRQDVGAPSLTLEYSSLPLPQAFAATEFRTVKNLLLPRFRDEHLISRLTGESEIFYYISFTYTAGARARLSNGRTKKEYLEKLTSQT